MDLEFHQLDWRYEGLRVRRPDRERRLLASLSERGQQVPIIVIALAGEPNRFLVIDGYKRLRALQRLHLLRPATRALRRWRLFPGPHLSGARLPGRLMHPRPRFRTAVGPLLCCASIYVELGLRGPVNKGSRAQLLHIKNKLFLLE